MSRAQHPPALADRLDDPPKLVFPQDWTLSGAWERAQRAEAYIGPTEDRAHYDVLLGRLDADELGDKHRETPLPSDLATTSSTVADLRDEADDVPLVDVSTRTVKRWVDSAAAELAEHPDDGWHYLTPHDLRRTWGTLLCEHEVEPGLVMTYGGWEDWDTFREHYLGQYSVKAQQRAREKVPWL